MKEREKLVLDKQTAIDFANDEYIGSDYNILKNQIIDTSRWSSTHELVIQRITDGKYFRDTYRKGLTEAQDEFPYDYTEPNFTEVFPKEVTVTIFV